MKHIAFALIWLLGTVVANAVTWTTDGSAADVQTKINAASSGDTIEIPAGTFLWSTGITIPATKGITLQGAGEGSTIIQRNNNTNNFGTINLTCGTTTPGTRITGITFRDLSTTPDVFGKAGFIKVGGSPINSKFRIDHCTFDIRSPSQLKYCMQIESSQFGLIDHCTFLDSGTDTAELIHNFGRCPQGGGRTIADAPPDWTNDIHQGTDEALYIEDCTFTNSQTTGNFNGISAIQNYAGARMVFRHNVVRNMQVDVHGNSNADGFIGGRWWEIYNNQFTHGANVNMDKVIQLRSGSGVVFGNSKTTESGAIGGANITMYYEDPADPYPGLWQVGRGKDQVLDPAYFWNNPTINVTVGDNPSWIQLNRDYFVLTAPQTKTGYTQFAYPHPLQGATTAGISATTAGIFYVDKDNPRAADTPSNGSENDPFASITYALSRISSGNTIYIKQSATPYNIGTGLYIYGPSGTAANPTTLKAYPGHSPVLVGAGNTGRCALDGVQYWTVEGLNISNLNHAIHVRNGSSNVIIRNNNLHDTGNEVVHVFGNSHDVLVENNTIRNAGILTAPSGSGTSGEGVYVGTHLGAGDFTHHVTIRGNTIDGCKHEGVEIKHDAHDCVVEENTISNCVANFEYGKYSILVFPMVNYGSNPNHIIRGNTIFNQGGAGTGAAIGLYTGAQAYNNVIYNVTAPACAFEIQPGTAFQGYADTFTRYVWNNTMDVPDARSIHNFGGTLSLGNNIGTSLTGAGGNLVFNSAYFVNAAARNYHLVAGSAPINAGSNPPFPIPTDFDGVARTAPADIGAYEFTGSSDGVAPRVTGTVPLMPGLTFEAEAGFIESPFAVASGTVSQSVQVFTPSSGGRARYRVTIPSTGNYRVNMNLNAPNIAADSLFIDFDQEPTTPTTIWDVQALTSGIETRTVSWRGTGAFDAPQFNPKVWNLSAGEHTLYIRGREAGMQVDAITIVPTVPLMPGLTFEAEAGFIESPFAVASGTVSQSVQVFTPSSGGRARYRVTIPSTGNYRVNMNLNAPNIAADSLFIDFDQEPTTPTTIWDVQALTSGIETRTVSWRGTGAFDAPQFNPKVWNLSAGEHTLYIRGREAGMQVDAITIVPQPSSQPPTKPENVHIISIQ